jgi:hypothetical protein
MPGHVDLEIAEWAIGGGVRNETKSQLNNGRGRGIA